MSHNVQWNDALVLAFDLQQKCGQKTLTENAVLKAEIALQHMMSDLNERLHSNTGREGEPATEEDVELRCSQLEQLESSIRFAKANSTYL